MAKTDKKVKKSWLERKIDKANNQTIRMYSVVPTKALDELAKLENEEDINETIRSQIQEHKDDDEGFLMRIYTIVPTRAEAEEFIIRHIVLRHSAHYKRWCELHNRKADSLDVARYYVAHIVDMRSEENHYTIMDVDYNFRDLALILRMTSNCAPIGCSFDHPVEIDSFLAHKAYEESLKKEEEEKIKAEAAKPAPKKRGRPAKAKPVDHEAVTDSTKN